MTGTAAPPMQAGSAGENQAQPGRQRVLIVDDERDILDEMCELLDGKGFSVSVAASAAEALQLLTADPELNTVVSDIRMPMVDGVEMIDRAMGDPALRDRPLRFIMVTGHATLADAQRSIRASAVDFVAKPIDTSQLLRAIARAGAEIAEELSARRSQQELGSRMESERSQRLALMAQNVKLEAQVEVAQSAVDAGAAAGNGFYGRLAEVLRRTVDPQRHHHSVARRVEAAAVAEFFACAAAELGLPVSGGGAPGSRPRGIPAPAVEDAVEAILLALRLNGADRLEIEASVDAPNGLRLLPHASASPPETKAAVPLAAEAAQLALHAAEISLGRAGGTLSIEDIDAERQALRIALPAPDRE